MTDNKLNLILQRNSTKFTEILDENPFNAQIFLLGETVNESNEKENFILKMQKKQFESSEILSPETIKKIAHEPLKYFSNDIYSKYTSTDLIQNKVNVELIYPATQKEIDKHRKMCFEIITETYDIYKNKTLAYINSLDKNHTKWIDNILYNNAEEILIKTDDFVILKNYTTVDNPNLLDCLGLPFINNIRSLRDLNATHLPLLKKFYVDGKKLLGEKFNCKPTEIRAFIHYPPSFYYFHVHFLHINEVNMSCCINRAIDLGEIINNIELKSDYYQVVSIDHSVKVGSKLHEYLTK